MVTSLVRDLYKRFLLVGRDYPEGLSVVRARAKEAFFKNKDLKDDVSIKKAIAHGRYWVRELAAVTRLHKYRTLKKRYDS